MKKTIGIILLFLVTLVACNDANDSNVTPNSHAYYNSSGENNTIGVIYNSNPYEWVGQNHNNILNYVGQYFVQPSGSCTDISFHNTVFQYVGIAYSELFNNNDVDLSNIDTEYWYYELANNNIDVLSEAFRNSIHSNIGITLKDKNYLLLVLNLSCELLDNNYDLNVGLRKIKTLENQVLNEQWNLANEGYALYSISYLKNSYSYWMAKYPDIHNTLQNKSNKLMAANRTKVAANAMADYIVGAATFLSATGATGGVGMARWCLGRS